MTMTIPSDDQDRKMATVVHPIRIDPHNDPEAQQLEAQIEQTRTTTTRTRTTTRTTTTTSATVTMVSQQSTLLENIQNVPFASATTNAYTSTDPKVNEMAQSLEKESAYRITECNNDNNDNDNHYYPPLNEKCHFAMEETFPDEDAVDVADASSDEENEPKLRLSPPILARSAPRRPLAAPGAYSVSTRASIRRFVTGVLTPMPITTSTKRIHGESGDEVEQLPETREVQQDESTTSPQEEIHSQKKLWIILAVVTMVVVITVIAVSVGITVGGNSRQTKREISMSPTISPLESQVSIELERIILYCSNTTNTTTKTITNDLLAPFVEHNQNRYKYIQLLYDSGWITDTNISIHSCQPEHVALLYLTLRQDDTTENATIIHHLYLLAVLYISWDGLHWNNNTKWLVSNSPCDWYGIECNSQQDPISLHLQGNGPRGTIPTLIGFLTTLQSLRLDGNIQIPVEIHNLERTPIAGTGRRGAILGSIPTELSRLTNLTIITLTDNVITGSIPTELTLLTNLEVLMVGSNMITGGIPITISNMKELKLLYLDFNKLSSSLPSSMAKLTQLIEISLSGNKFNGTLPFLNVANSLVFVDVQLNQFSGTLPTTIGLCTNLIYLALSSNQFHGTLPSELGQLAHLNSLFVSNTMLEGTVPQEICQLRTNGILSTFAANCAKEETPLIQCLIPECCTQLSECGND